MMLLYMRPLAVVLYRESTPRPSYTGGGGGGGAGRGQGGEQHQCGKGNVFTSSANCSAELLSTMQIGRVKCNRPQLVNT